jgi:hypothetical protein
MKLLQSTLLLSLFCIFCSMKPHLTNVDHTDVTITDSKEYYEVSAEFKEEKTGKVQGYLNDQLRQAHDPSFNNTKIDATLTFTDHTVFYIKLEPGELKIKFDKRINSAKALAKFKKMGSGLSKLLGE